MTGSADWDAATYDRIADPMTRWGGAVLDQLTLAGDETVLDAGCGSGRVTERLLERLPHGRVIALDASPAMIEEARSRLAGFGDRVQFVVADLLEPLPVDRPVDAILSTATFHWVLDHDRLWRNLAAAIRPGGQVAAQYGGAGNVRSVLAAAEAAGGPVDAVWSFATPDAERARLEKAGFTEVRAWLQPEPTPIEPGEPMETYLRTIILREHLRKIEPGRREAFVRDVAGRIPDSVIDYVRLNVLARRA